MNFQLAQDPTNSPALSKKDEHHVGKHAPGMLLSQSQVIRHVRCASTRASHNKDVSFWPSMEQTWPPSSTCSVWSETAPADAWQRTPCGLVRPGIGSAPLAAISLSGAASGSSTSWCSPGGGVTKSCLQEVSPGCASFSLVSKCVCTTGIFPNVWSGWWRAPVRPHALQKSLFSGDEGPTPFHQSEPMSSLGRHFDLGQAYSCRHAHLSCSSSGGFPVSSMRSRCVSNRPSWLYLPPLWGLMMRSACSAEQTGKSATTRTAHVWLPAQHVVTTSGLDQHTAAHAVPVSSTRCCHHTSCGAERRVRPIFQP